MRELFEDEPKLVMLQISDQLREEEIQGHTPKELKKDGAEMVASALEVGKSRLRVNEIVAENDGFSLSLQLILVILPAMHVGDETAPHLARTLVSLVKGGTTAQLKGFSDAWVFEAPDEDEEDPPPPSRFDERFSTERLRDLAATRYHYRRLWKGFAGFCSLVTEAVQRQKLLQSVSTRTQQKIILAKFYLWSMHAHKMRQVRKHESSKVVKSLLHQTFAMTHGQFE
jgi:hypothetical protein